MGLFFNYDNSVCNDGDATSVFSYDPTIYSLKELLVYELSQASYYGVKLRDSGEDIAPVFDKILEFAGMILVNMDFRKEKLMSVIKSVYDFVLELEARYKSLCDSKGEAFEPLNGEKLSFGTKKNARHTVKFGEKQIMIKNTEFSKAKKQLTEIAVILVSHAIILVNEIERYEGNADSLKYTIPEIVNDIYFSEDNDDVLRKKICEFANVSYDTLKALSDLIKSKYGPVVKTSVNLDIKQGKAILVSGHFFKNLENLLDAVDGSDINVYTHGEMMFAHAFSFFKKYRNLAGHYQLSLNNVAPDFAKFPGPVLITQNSLPNTDIIRGNIFSTDANPSYGLGKVADNDFSPLINAADDAEGFLQNISIGSINTGFDENVLKNKVREILREINENKVKRLFLIGLTNFNSEQNVYFEKFFEIVPENCKIISFSYGKQRENIIGTDTSGDSSLILSVIEELAKNPEIFREKVTVFLTQCNFRTILFAIKLKNLGVKNVFIGKCCPNVFSPTTVAGLRELFDVKKIDLPEIDLSDTAPNTPEYPENGSF
ncbi:MAG: hypothetical protein ACI4CY_03795 [Candidatus Gastranaerophilaceae bacterium]